MKKEETKETQKRIELLERLWKIEQKNKDFYKSRCKRHEQYIECMMELLMENFQFDADTITEICCEVERKLYEKQRRCNKKIDKWTDKVIKMRMFIVNTRADLRVLKKFKGGI